MSNIRTFAQLTQQLTTRAAGVKAASTKAAAGDTPTETDPREKGVTAVPKDPNASTATMNLPANSTNTDVTPVTTLTPAKTVGSEEKTANSLTAKAAKVAAGIAALHKKATAAEITPTLVSDKGSDNKDTHPAPSTSNAPAPKQNPDPVAKEAAPVPDPKDPNAKTISMPTPDSKGDLPKETANSNDVTTKKSEEGCLAGDKMASEFDATFHVKLASMILSTEEGREYARSVIEAAHGAAEAESIIKAAAVMEAQAAEYAELEAQGAFEAERMWQAASPEERAQIVKLANAHALAKSTLATEQEKQAYDAGAASGAELADAGALGDPSAAGGAPGGAPAGAADPSAGGAPAPGADEISDDDIMAVLSELVQAGKIKPEEAEAILQALQGGGAEANPTAPAGADAGGAGPAGPTAPPEAPEGATPDEKAAYAIVKSASVATDAIMALIATSAAK